MLNIQSIKALLNSDNFKRGLSNAMTNVFYNGYSVDHVYGIKGQPVIALRLQNGRINLRDSKGNDITNYYLNASL